MNKYEELKSRHKWMLQQAKDEGYDLECAFQSGVLKTLDELKKDIIKAQAFDVLKKYLHISTYDGDSYIGESDKEELVLDDYLMNQEEFELLKEVLKNE